MDSKLTQGVKASRLPLTSNQKSFAMSRGKRFESARRLFPIGFYKPHRNERAGRQLHPGPFVAGESQMNPNEPPKPTFWPMPLQRFSSTLAVCSTSEQRRHREMMHRYGHGTED
jgi:hypothetical protein